MASAAAPSSTQPNYLSHEVTAGFCSLPTRGKVCLEYIWLTRLAGVGSTPSVIMRGKTRVVDRAPQSVAQLEPWSSDALAANQGTDQERFGYKVEVLLRPAFMCDDPFRGAPHKLVLCDVCYPDGTPLPCNNRARASKLFRSLAREEPWFGIEQEYLLMEADRKTPLGWPRDGVPPTQVSVLQICEGKVPSG
jgi:glutamine synthetase